MVVMTCMSVANAVWALAAISLLLAPMLLFAVAYERRMTDEWSSLQKRRTAERRKAVAAAGLSRPDRGARQGGR